MAKVPPKSVYKSPKSVAKNQNITVSVDDPRAAWDKAGQFKARAGAEVDVVGLDGTPLIAGGKSLTSSFSSTGTNKVVEEERFVLPGVNGGQASIKVGYGAIVPTDITNVSTAWSTESGKTEDLIVTFDWDYADPANATVSEFILEITLSTGTIRQTAYGLFPVNRTQTGQTARFTQEINKATLGDLSVNISKVCVYAIDAFYNTSGKVCDTTIPAYVLDLPVPVITVTSAISGYSVAYTIPSQSVFDAIDIYEYESNASTEPTGVTYSRVYFDQVSPANIITVNNNARWVKARFTSKVAVSTAFSAAQKVTPTSPVTIDATGPANVTSVSVTSGIDTTGYLGFNGYADISWPAVSDSTLRGYRVRFSNDGGTTYAYANSPGTGTTYRLGGLAIGSTYKIAVATYDEFNNTSSSYVSLSPDLTISGTPSVSNYITAGPFQFGVGVGGVSTNKGLYFDSSNYWYINSSNSARLKVGGSTSNYLLWDGATFSIDGDITARAGYFAGNVGIISGGSLYSGTISGGALSGAGYILNSTGLKFNSSSVNDITTINGTTGKLTTASASIGGWDVTSSAITKTATGQGKISLDSTNGYIYVTKDNVETTTAGINSPSADTDTVFWSGGTLPGSSPTPTPSFLVKLNGDLFASSAIITGTVNATQGGFGTIVNGVVTKGWEIDVDGIKAKSTGRIKIGNYSIKSDNNSDFDIYDDVTGTKIVQTDTASTTDDSKRIFLGDNTRQVEVVKSAGVWPDGATATFDAASSTGKQQYRSGGLRNIFTILEGNLSKNPSGDVLEFPSAIKGDMLIVWDSSGDGGNWRKIVETYINVSGTAPGTTTTAAPGTTTTAAPGTTTTAAPGTTTSTTTTTTTTLPPTNYCGSGCDGEPSSTECGVGFCPV